MATIALTTEALALMIVLPLNVFAKENVDAFYLEYDDERSGSFEALKFIPKDKQVVLGIITSKKPELEKILIR